MPKLTISVASEDEINELTRPITKIDYGCRVVGVPTTHNAALLRQWLNSERDMITTLNKFDYVLSNMAQKYKDFTFSNDDKHRIAHNALNYSKSGYLTLNQELELCIKRFYAEKTGKIEDFTDALRSC